jgi:hypothetical protein
MRGNSASEVDQNKPSRSIDMSLPSTSASTLCQRDMSWIGGEYLTPNVDTLECAHANGVPKSNADIRAAWNLVLLVGTSICAIEVMLTFRISGRPVEKIFWRNVEVREEEFPDPCNL